MLNFFYRPFRQTSTSKIVIIIIGDKMKKTIILSIAFLIIGIILGNKIYTAKNSFTNVFSEGETYYFLQEGIYSNLDILEENIKNITPKYINQQDNKYYVYLGITKDINNAKKLKEIYTKKGYAIYIKEQKINNEEFKSNITQLDILLSNATTEKELLTITEVIIANYEEIVKMQ